MSYSVGQLHKYAVKLYKTLEEETGQKVGFSVVSNIRLATTQDRMDEYYQYSGVAKRIFETTLNPTFCPVSSSRVL